jgi:Uma2 family endonuclease
MAIKRTVRETRTAYRAKERTHHAKSRKTVVSTPSVALPWQPPEQGKWTYADWSRLPDDGTRYEVIDGELYMTPPPAISHQMSLTNLLDALRAFVRERNLGIVLPSPIGVHLPTQPVPVEPDIVYVSAAHKSIMGKEYIEGVPDLVIEVLSPSNWIYDRKEKYQVYQTARVPEYWIVDYRAKTIEVFVLEQGAYALLDKWGVGDDAASRVLDGFQVSVADIFRDI